jgi:ankyrin repeat protein
MANPQENELHIACRNNDLNEVRRLLQPRNHPEYARARDAKGCLPLHTACQNVAGADKDVVQELLNSYPLSARVTDYDGCLPLHAACQNSHGANKDVVDKLLEKYPEGARVPDKNGCLPLHAACQNIAGADKDVVDKLLEKYPEGARVTNFKGDLPLHIAIDRKADNQIIEKLLNNCPRANPNIECSKLPEHLGTQKDAKIGVISMVNILLGVAALLFTLISNFSCQYAVSTLTLALNSTSSNYTFYFDSSKSNVTNIYHGIWTS